ncbi:hypothetical protein JXA05_03140 [Candidatus Peregrinibacteria bacterium]|nr:hypothetical protein [Candidatus Peregrinibacteria bacterium]
MFKFLHKIRSSGFWSHLKYLLTLLVAVAAVAMMATTTIKQVDFLATDIMQTSKQIESQKTPEGSIKLEVVQPLIAWRFEMPNKYRMFRMVSYNLTVFLSAALLMYAINKKED